MSTLPRAGMVVALWGRTGGTAEDLADNARLVATSHAVARSCGARRLLHLSSAAVYGPGRALDEAAPLCPAGDYGRAKLAMERAVARLPGGEGIAHCSMRLANVVGADSLAPGLAGHGPVAMDRFPGGGGPRRSYIAASDLLRILAGLAALPAGGLPAVLNVAAPDPVDMDALVRAAGLKLAWRPAPKTAIPELTLDTGRLTRLLPRLSYRTGATDMVADWKELEAMT